jgi:hypothetical protein
VETKGRETDYGSVKADCLALVDELNRAHVRVASSTSVMANFASGSGY